MRSSVAQCCVSQSGYVLRETSGRSLLDRGLSQLACLRPGVFFTGFRKHFLFQFLSRQVCSCLAAHPPVYTCKPGYSARLDDTQIFTFREVTGRMIIVIVTCASFAFGAVVCRGLPRAIAVSAIAKVKLSSKSTWLATSSLQDCFVFQLTASSCGVFPVIRDLMFLQETKCCCSFVF